MGQINPRKIIKRWILTPCEHTRVQQVGIDLTINRTVHMDSLQSKKVNMNEIVKLPKNVFALFIHRSSYNRKGILITGSVYDPGYQGVAGCTVYNLSGDRITIPQNSRIGQMIFFKAKSASIYKGKYLKEGLS